MLIFPRELKFIIKIIYMNSSFKMSNSNTMDQLLAQFNLNIYIFFFWILLFNRDNFISLYFWHDLFKNMKECRSWLKNYIYFVDILHKSSLLQKSMHFLCLFLISCLLLSSTSCFNLSCNGRSIYTKITINNNAGYVPQFYTTFGISLEANETLT